MADVITKVCKQCGDRKSLESFNKGKSTFGTHTWCRECCNIRSKEHYESQWSRYILRRFGVDAEWYAEQYIKQHGVCAICGERETATRNGVVKKLAIDHDHNSGEVRGLLCQRCNMAIGLLRENEKVWESARKYLDGEA